MKIGIDSICLLYKILEVPKKNSGIEFDKNDYDLREKINKVIEEFTEDKSNLVEFYSLNGPKTNIKVVRECIKKLMEKAETFFGNKDSKNGVYGELLQESAKNDLERFSEPLKLLSEAAAAITEACKRLAYDIEEK